MSDTYIPQTSASDRYEAARKALEWYDDQSEAGGGIVAGGHAVAEALRALITPPGVGEMPDLIDLYARAHQRALPNEDGPFSTADLDRAADAGRLAIFNAGIQSAHESWECEDRPTQEQMLRWLGINYMTGPGEIAIYGQTIDRED